MACSILGPLGGSLWVEAGSPWSPEAMYKSGRRGFQATGALYGPKMSGVQPHEMIICARIDFNQQHIRGAHVTTA